MKIWLICIFMSALCAVSTHATVTIEKTLTLRFLTVLDGPTSTVNGTQSRELIRVRMTTDYFIDGIAWTNGWWLTRRARIIRIEEYGRTGNLERLRFVIRDPGFADRDITNFFTFNWITSQGGFRLSGPRSTGPFEFHHRQTAILRSNLQGAYRIDLQGLVRFKGQWAVVDDHLVPIYNWLGNHTGEDFFSSTPFSIFLGRMNTIGLRIMR